MADSTIIYSGTKVSQLSAYPDNVLNPDDLFLISKYNESDSTYTSYKINYQDFIPSIAVNNMLCNVYYDSPTKQLVL